MKKNIFKLNSCPPLFFKCSQNLCGRGGSHDGGPLGCHWGAIFMVPSQPWTTGFSPGHNGWFIIGCTKNDNMVIDRELVTISSIVLMFYDVYATRIQLFSQQTIFRIGVLPVLQDSDASLHSHRDHPHRGSSPLKWKGCKQGSLARDWSIKRLAACNMCSFFSVIWPWRFPTWYLFFCVEFFFVDHCSNLSCRLKWDVWEQKIFERPESARLCCALFFFCNFPAARGPGCGTFPGRQGSCP